jgi:tetratricopeptide (TPR) repeat protein
VYIPVSKILKLKLKSILILAGILLVLVGALAVTEYQSVKKARLVQEVANAIDESHNLLYGSDFAGAQAILDNALKKTNDPKQKAKIYLEKALIALNSGNTDETIRFANESNALSESHQAYAAIGQAAQEQGNWQLAADSFNKAASLVPDPGRPEANSPYNDYKILEKEALSKL